MCALVWDVRNFSKYLYQIPCERSAVATAQFTVLDMKKLMSEGKCGLKGGKCLQGAYRQRVWGWEANFMLTCSLYSFTKVKWKDPGLLDNHV